jgi:hypothetical protein
LANSEVSWHNLKYNLESGMRNRHPADQLAEVRRDLEDLKAKEKFLRTLLLQTGDFRGEEWRAHPQERSQQRLDSVAARQRYGELLEPFQVTQTYTILRLVRVIGTVANGFPVRRALNHARL